MMIVIAWDGDKIGRAVGRASLNDDVEGLRRISQAIDSGNLIWKSWIELSGGNLIASGGDEGRAEIPADKLDELPAIREQYAGAVNTPVSVGVGLKLSEADKALVAAKLQGGNRIVFYTDEVGAQVEEARRRGQKTEEQKIADEYLNKAESTEAEQKYRRDYFKEERLGPVIDKYLKDKIGRVADHDVYAVDGEGIRTDLDIDFTSGANPARYSYVPLDQLWVDENLSPLDRMATLLHEYVECNWMRHQGESYDVAHDQASDREIKFRDHFKDHEPTLEEVEDYARPSLSKAVPAMNPGPHAGFGGAHQPVAPAINKPSVGQGDHEQGQAIYDLLAEDRPPAPEMTHAAADYERQLHDEAWKGEEEDADAEGKKHTNLEQIKSTVVQALQALKAQAPVLEQMRGAAPEAYQAMMGLSQAVIGLARELTPQQQPQPAALDKNEDDLAKADRAIELVHYSTHPGLKHIDTKHMGTGAPAAEYKQGLPEVPRAYYYRAGTEPEPLVTQGAKGVYGATLGLKHRLYDIGKDPEGLRGPARARFLAGKGLNGPDDTFLHDVKKKGYSGYYNSAGAAPDTVALFHSHPVRALGKDELKVEADPEEKMVSTSALDKAGLPMPNPRPKPMSRPVLPAGSVVDDKVKVTHQTGKSSWVQVGSGQILSQDPSHHPISSRNPSGR